ncbi:MAG: hypothetical protein PF692_11295 [Kiritimatiellae bacterium]|jgi:hexosaminidase|nr:hypothetical protein [Kiritimatiellia bacterium]
MSKLTQKAPLTTPEKDICARAIFWNDPILQIYRKNQLQYDDQWSSKVISRYKNILKSIADVPKSDEASFEYGKTLLNILIHKLELMDKLDCAYAEKNTQKLTAISQLASEIISELEEFSTSFREYQYERYNPQGFEILQIRIGGLKERFKEVSLRVEELLHGKIDSIPELHEKASYRLVNKHYHDLATASYFV